jgi:hypothetical protein
MAKSAVAKQLISVVWEQVAGNSPRSGFNFTGQFGHIGGDVPKRLNFGTNSARRIVNIRSIGVFLSACVL